MAGGVPAGTNMPYQNSRLYSGSPASFIPGSSGTSGERSRVLTASREQPSALDLGQHRRRGAESQLRVARHDGLDGRGAALVGDVRHLRACQLTEERRAQVRRRTVARRGVVELAGILLRGSDQVGHRADAGGGVDRQHQRRRRHLGDGDEIARLVPQLGIQRGIDRNAAWTRDQQRVAVRRRLGDDAPRRCSSRRPACFRRPPAGRAPSPNSSLITRAT